MKFLFASLPVVSAISLVALKKTLESEASVIECFSSIPAFDILTHSDPVSRLPPSLIPSCGPILSHQVVSLAAECHSALLSLVRLYRPLLLSEDALVYLQKSIGKGESSPLALASAIYSLTVQLDLGSHFRPDEVEREDIPFYAAAFAKLGRAKSARALQETKGSESILSTFPGVVVAVNEAEKAIKDIQDTQDFHLLLGRGFLSEMARLYGLSLTQTLLLHGQADFLSWSTGGELLWGQYLKETPVDEGEDPELVEPYLLTILTPVERAVMFMEDQTPKKLRDWKLGVRLAENPMVSLALNSLTDAQQLAHVAEAWEDVHWVSKVITEVIGLENLLHDLVSIYDVVFPYSLAHKCPQDRAVCVQALARIVTQDSGFWGERRLTASLNAGVLGRNPLVEFISMAFQDRASSKLLKLSDLVHKEGVRTATPEEILTEISSQEMFIKLAAEAEQTSSRGGKRKRSVFSDLEELSIRSSRQLKYLHEFRFLGEVLGAICAENKDERSRLRLTDVRGFDDELVLQISDKKNPGNEKNREPWIDALVEGFGAQNISDDSMLLCLLHAGRISEEAEEISSSRERMRAKMEIKQEDGIEESGEPVIRVRKETVLEDTRSEVSRLVRSGRRILEAGSWGVEVSGESSDEISDQRKTWLEMCTEELFPETGGVVFEKNRNGDFGISPGMKRNVHKLTEYIEIVQVLVLNCLQHRIPLGVSLDKQLLTILMLAGDGNFSIGDFLRKGTLPKAQMPPKEHIDVFRKLLLTGTHP